MALEFRPENVRKVLKKFQFSYIVTEISVFWEKCSSVWYERGYTRAMGCLLQMQSIM